MRTAAEEASGTGMRSRQAAASLRPRGSRRPPAREGLRDESSGQGRRRLRTALSGTSPDRWLLPGSGSSSKDLPARGPSGLRSGPVRSGEGALQGSRPAPRVCGVLGWDDPGPGVTLLLSALKSGELPVRAPCGGPSRASLGHSSSCSSSSEPEGPWRTSSYHLFVSVFIWMRPWWRSWGGRRGKPLSVGQGQAQGQGREGQLLCALWEETAGRAHGQLQSVN